MKHNFLLILILVFVSHGRVQGDKLMGNKGQIDMSFISNKKIKYSIVLMSCDTCIPIRNVGYRVIVHLGKNEKNLVRKISYNKWVELLRDSSSDWAANLILYDIYNKDALLLSRYDDICLWRKYMKNEDIDYWIDKLK